MGVRLLHYSDIENAYDRPERVGRLAGLLRDLDGPDAVVAGTGDNTSPGVLALLTEGRQSLSFFRAVEPDVETFGNHDFDYGPDATRTVVRESPQTWVSANVRRDGEPFGADAGVVPWTVLEADGSRVGVFGVTDPTTGSINPNAAELAFTDPVAAAGEAVADLRERGVEYVVALSHLGAGDEDLARAVDVDAVLGGHVHTERAERIDGTVLTRPGVNAAAVYEVRLGADDAAVTRHATADAAPAAAVVDALEACKRRAGLDEVVARVEEPIPRDDTTTFEGECRVGNLVADAYRWATGADVGLQNSGGIRPGPPLSGAVTVADLVSLIPFEEPVEVAELSGTELLSVFREAAADGVTFGEDGWWHGHVGGARLIYDADAGLVEARVGGEPVDPDATYTLATSAYLFHTDHEFPTLTDDHRVASFETQYDVLVAYAREVGLDPELEGRIVLR